MDDIETKERFDDHFYAWAMEEANREVRDDFPTLEMVKGSASWGARDYLKSLRPELRKPLMKALVKRVSRSAPLTKLENRLLKGYLDLIADYSEPHRARYRAERFKSGLRSKGVDKKALAALSKDKLTAKCGEITVRYSAYHWVHSVLCQGWLVNTYVEVRNSVYQLSYYHDVVSPLDELAILKSNVSALLWLGIFPTEWDLLGRGDEAAAANSLEQVCAHFIDSLAGLLAEL